MAVHKARPRPDHRAYANEMKIHLKFALDSALLQPRANRSGILII
jgi:hypothetical protein